MRHSPLVTGNRLQRHTLPIHGAGRERHEIITLSRPGAGGKVGERVVVQDTGDRIPDLSHDVLDRTLRIVGIRAIPAFLVGGLADTTDGGKRAVENADDLAERDVGRRLDQSVAAFHASPARQQACPLQGQEDLFEEFHWNMLTGGDFVALQSGSAVCQGQFQQCAEGVLTFF
jgi:hypothetical protein